MVCKRASRHSRILEDTGGAVVSGGETAGTADVTRPSWAKRLTGEHRPTGGSHSSRNHPSQLLKSGVVGLRPLKVAYLGRARKFGACVRWCSGG